MTKRVIITNEKDGCRVYDADDPEAVARMLVRERLESGEYYFDEAEESARRALQRGRAYAFLNSRREHEYEGFEVADVLRES